MTRDMTARLKRNKLQKYSPGGLANKQSDNNLQSGGNQNPEFYNDI